MTTHSEDTQAHTIVAIQQALDDLNGLTLLGGVLRKQPWYSLLTLLRALTSSTPDAAHIAEAYSRTFEELAEAATAGELEPAVSDAWQACILARLLNETNSWSIQAERAGVDGLSPTIRA